MIDDDIRNIFSLATALEGYGIALRYAERGREGLAMMEAAPRINIALIDIMMSDMDGYDTIREIRSRATFHDLPLIAVTAKAMKGDRQKCIQAGASDYISKPVRHRSAAGPAARVGVAGGRRGAGRQKPRRGSCLRG